MCIIEQLDIVEERPSYGNQTENWRVLTDKEMWMGNA
jgi:hypothetical protein